MTIEFFFVYLAGILALSVVGNGFYSWITFRKSIKLSTLETIAISLGIGITFIISYGYLIDFFVSVFGLLPNTQFLILDIIPLTLGIVLKLSCLKYKIGKNNSLKTQIISTIRDLWQEFRKRIQEIKPQIQSIMKKGHKALFIVLSCIAFLAVYIFLDRITYSFYYSSGQFSIDPYNWVNSTIQFGNNLTIDYTFVRSYPAGFIIFDAFFLPFFYGMVYSTQFFFLKWSPFLDIFLFYFILYLIFKRLSKNPVYFLLTFLLTFNMYFFYRFTMSLPSPLVVIVLELMILMMLIPEIPQFIIYLMLGTTLAIHPINGLFVCVFFFAYKLLSGLIKVYKSLKMRHKSTEEEIRATKRKTVKDVFNNFIAFLLPLAFLVFSLTFRYDPNWLGNYWFYIQSGSIVSNLNATAEYLALAFNLINPIVVQVIIDWSSLGEKVSWLFGWGNPYFIFTLISIFIPQKFYADSKEKNNLALFLRISILIGFVIFLLPTFEFLLDLLGFLPGGSFLVTLIRSDFYTWTAVRLFEVSNVLNALLMVMIIEKLVSIISIKTRTAPVSPRTTSHKIRTATKIIAIILTVDIFFFNPYWEYNYNSYSIDSMLWFRDYLDRQNPGEKVIGCSPEDSNILALSGLLLPKGNNYTKIGYNITLSGINVNFTTNPSNTFNFLVISFITMNATIVGEIREAYIGSAYEIYHNALTLILKF